jgi:hypothetical protein
MVAAIIREHDDEVASSRQEEASHLTTPTLQAGQIRGITQASIDNISQVMNRRRTVGAYYTTAISNKIPSYSNVSALQQGLDRSCRAEFDTHADTCGVNNVARIISYTGKTAHVSPFTPDLNKIKDVPIVKAAIAYDDSMTGETYVIIINQALYFDTALPHILLNPNQMRAYGFQVDDVPKHLSKGTSSHSIFFQEEEIRIPLLLNGCISYFTVRTPSDKEINQCLHLIATSESIEWEPYSSCFAELEGIPVITQVD